MTTLGPGVTFILGGARSGKSAFAEELVISSGLEAVYLATAQSLDGEMEDRIQRHRDRRGADWKTVEEPLELVASLRTQVRPGRAVLVDCLTLWITNLMLAERDIAAETQTLIDRLKDISGSVVLVSNEVGLGIVPENAMARAFRDHAGHLHQRVASCARNVFFVAAGLPLKMKG
ncbi:bifunctional adenosylcobinamide kinase/adenosylcobinamide-phosphate guanylyltransferase [Hoeflea prorocentri]|uniref:Bifunctional adenosylcobalamin biosynthesis protein n=1 Tax=Hoeflea prorocentri TaxID=1922333 RepID=A0A9X3UG10_9HYPH|nr:bifunctional adenosylcobinamide kinase/adenosylcobinamide-phosphate guanylyltransferase [Hoeflea prorocentri]MCY6380062.1 bifunctional adenosylcobinamide kinase/adenosylcobinamide-phosphate guanylyltransferase [Hoeflea prorocentri]MDA5397862.1 bifunctional adenosylcobinamide kinase/adenosylcobinamide-phosphate guanylyltransferase [Hoeflea prorocentri]